MAEVDWVNLQLPSLELLEEYVDLQSISLDRLEEVNTEYVFLDSTNRNNVAIALRSLFFHLTRRIRSGKFEGAGPLLTAFVAEFEDWNGRRLEVYD